MFKSARVLLPGEVLRSLGRELSGEQPGRLVERRSIGCPPQVSFESAPILRTGRARRVQITAAGKRTALRCLNDALSVYGEILERLGSRSDRVLNALAELVDATELTADARDSATD